LDDLKIGWNEITLDGYGIHPIGLFFFFKWRAEV